MREWQNPRRSWRKKAQTPPLETGRNQHVLHNLRSSPENNSTKPIWGRISRSFVLNFFLLVKCVGIQSYVVYKSKLDQFWLKIIIHHSHTASMIESEQGHGASVSQMLATMWEGVYLWMGSLILVLVSFSNASHSLDSYGILASLSNASHSLDSYGIKCRVL